MVPTTISDKAVDTRNQIDNSDAMSARPSHSAAKAQMDVMVLPPRFASASKWKAG